ncbi:MAG: transglutaminase domain-containing protein [Pseudobutyrivibrio sp.]|nr:transglutaminase domain-containing protein [Pseudobutyrivibrio sp.]
MQDVTPPEISGVEQLEFAQGDAISYKKNIVVTDDIDENPTLEVDTSEVNPDKRGIYPITYIATDAAGNTTEKSTKVRIVSAKIAAATEETVNAMADEILAEIITDDMDQLQQARAVYDWVVDNITYSESAGIDDLYSAAYKGMYNRIGDCTVKQKTAEVMLNRLGIKNMEIEKIRDTRGHYWLLIDVGEGWYHYDPNLQLDGTKIFYWHDADLWEYSNSHHNTHNYDKSKYPQIQ